MKIDLHAHSTASDGSFSPSELIHHAASLQIELMALTDHDTLDGLEEFHEAGKMMGIETLSGIELSVDYDGGSLHLLGYGFDISNVDLNRVLVELRESRVERNEKIINKLREFGYTITSEGVAKRAGNGVAGRPHIAAELVATGEIESVSVAFSELLGSESSAYFDRKRLTLEDACNLIHQAGGPAVWAHPGLHGSKLPDLLLRVGEWKMKGMDGLESDYSSHSFELRDLLRAIAGENKLIATGGSDFHGSYRPNVKLGQGPEGHPIHDECYYQLFGRINEIRTKLLTGR